MQQHTPQGTPCHLEQQLNNKLFSCLLLAYRKVGGGGGGGEAGGRRWVSGG
jgi:hypothetical protein